MTTDYTDIFLEITVPRGSIAATKKRNRNPQITQIHADFLKKKKKIFGNTNYANYTNQLHEIDKR